MCYKINMRYKTFTLVEVIIVILIIGTLTAVGVPYYQDAARTSRFDVFQSNLKIITSNLEKSSTEASLIDQTARIYPLSLSDPIFKSMFTKDPINPYTNRSMLDGTEESGLQYNSDDFTYKLCVIQADVDDIDNDGDLEETLGGILGAQGAR